MKTILFFSGLIFLTACGVKGDPVPPQAPPPIGRGKPSYSKATMTLPASKKRMPQEKDWIDEEEEMKTEDTKEEGHENEN